MANDTKERILEAALEMFSQKGYAGTNVRELSASLGLVKSGVYKHYESKEAIWNALLDQMIAYYAERFGSPEHLPPVPDSLEGLVTMTMRMVDFTVHDENVVKTRKLLTLEQFRDIRARELATKHFLTGLTDMFTRIFAGMMEKGLLRKDDPAMLAFTYTAPISTLIHLCDREPEKTDEAMAQIEAFSRHFIGVYRAEKHFTRLTRADRIGEVTVRPLKQDERPAALALAWRVFSEFESPDYAPEGTEEFRKCLHDEKYLYGLQYYGAFDENRLIGEVAIRPEKRHICFFFVDGRYHRRGIGTRLFRYLLEDYPNGTITLNSSPYGLPFYTAIGFMPTDEEQTVNGIRFTPMIFEHSQKGGSRDA